MIRTSTTLSLLLLAACGNGADSNVTADTAERHVIRASEEPAEIKIPPTEAEITRTKAEEKYRGAYYSISGNEPSLGDFQEALATFLEVAPELEDISLEEDIRKAVTGIIESDSHDLDSFEYETLVPVMEAGYAEDQIKGFLTSEFERHLNIHETEGYSRKRRYNHWTPNEVDPFWCDVADPYAMKAISQILMPGSKEAEHWELVVADVQTMGVNCDAAHWVPYKPEETFRVYAERGLQGDIDSLAAAIIGGGSDQWMFGLLDYKEKQAQVWLDRMSNEARVALLVTHAEYKSERSRHADAADLYDLVGLAKKAEEERGKARRQDIVG